MKRLSFNEAKAQYIHRFTMEHIPAWAKQQRKDGTFYAPQFATDREWYYNTVFYGESYLADKKHCYTTNQTWPLGQALEAPYHK